APGRRSQVAQRYTRSAVPGSPECQLLVWFVFGPYSGATLQRDDHCAEGASLRRSARRVRTARADQARAAARPSRASAHGGSDAGLRGAVRESEGSGPKVVQVLAIAVS